MTLLNLTRGVARELVGPADVPLLRASGVLVDDPRRQRPRWFDGRFLAAGDLVREQQYLLSREADLGRAAGSGVAAGLRVAEGAGPSTLSIQPGHGITPSGELVLLPRRVDLSLADATPAERLSSRFGLGRLPQPPLRSRTGVFVLALRPVEYTANPVGAYPSSITGQRTVEDGDVVEATAVVLVPWPDDGAADALAARRGRVARDLFVAGGAAPAAAGADLLPLAMVAVENNVVAWLDEAMLRRELGADRGDLPGLGFSPRALRLAHLVQHQDHLADVLAAGAAGRRGWPAAAHFQALPPAGPLPPGTIDPADFTQGYFPSEIDVDFTPVPEDELPALIEDALALPPIDLAAPAASLDSTALMIVAPVPRADWRAVVARLTTLTRPVRTTAPNLLAQRKPFELLQRLRLPRVAVPLDATDPSDAEWRRLAQLPSLWFVRRRQLALRADGVGAAQAISGGDERIVELGLRSRLAGLGLEPQFDALLEGASASAAATLTHLLAAPRYAASPALTAAAIGALAEAGRAARREAAGRDGGASGGGDVAVSSPPSGGTGGGPEDAGGAEPGAGAGAGAGDDAGAGAGADLGTDAGAAGVAAGAGAAGGGRRPEPAGRAARPAAAAPRSTWPRYCASPPISTRRAAAPASSAWSAPPAAATSAPPHCSGWRRTLPGGASTPARAPPPTPSWDAWRASRSARSRRKRTGTAARRPPPAARATRRRRRAAAPPSCPSMPAARRRRSGRGRKQRQRWR